MTAEEAARYHQPHIELLAASGVDMIGALSMSHPDEAIGICAPRGHRGFRLWCHSRSELWGPCRRATRFPWRCSAWTRRRRGIRLYFMIDCAHPTHFTHVLAAREAWLARIRGLRVNASAQSTAEIDAAPVPDRGDPVALGRQLAMLCSVLPDINVLGGCRGTDREHIEEIARVCRRLFEHVLDEFRYRLTVTRKNVAGIDVVP